MSQRAFTAAMEALQAEQEAHISTRRRHAAYLMETADLTAADVDEHLCVIDLQEEQHRELLSALALLHSLETAP